MIAITGQLVPNTTQLWHPVPDGGACFPMSDGGWAYTSNSYSELLRRTLRRRYGETEISEGLNELEALGFVETEAASARHDLDFTGGFLLAELLAKQKAA